MANAAADQDYQTFLNGRSNHQGLSNVLRIRPRDARSGRMHRRLALILLPQFSAHIAYDDSLVNSFGPPRLQGLYYSARQVDHADPVASAAMGAMNHVVRILSDPFDGTGRIRPALGQILHPGFDSAIDAYNARVSSRRYADQETPRLPARVLGAIFAEARTSVRGGADPIQVLNGLPAAYQAEYDRQEQEVTQRVADIANELIIYDG